MDSGDSAEARIEALTRNMKDPAVGLALVVLMQELVRRRVITPDDFDAILGRMVDITDGVE